MFASVYDKTDKGREEIATRKHHLPNKLRPLLVMIDGKQQVPGLLQKVGPLGLNEDNLQELLLLELIAPVDNSVLQHPAAYADSPPPAPETGNTEDAEEKIGVDKYQEIYRFFNEHIKANLGLRGFALQLKVERAVSLDDFRALRRPFLEAVMKTKGREFARELRDQIDPMLFGEDLQEADSWLKID